MSDPSETGEKKQTSAETLVAVSLISVCVVVGIAAWLSYNMGVEEEKPPEVTRTPAPTQSAQAPRRGEEAVLDDWQREMQREADLRALPQDSESEREKAARQAEASARRGVEMTIVGAPATRVSRPPVDTMPDAPTIDRTMAPSSSRNDMLNDLSRAPIMPPRPSPSAATRPSDVKPATIDWSSCQKPSYPAESVRLNEEGPVVMTFAVDSSGNSSNWQVKQSSGSGRLDNAAVDALSKCRFRPETRDGIAQASTGSIRFDWKLN